MTKEEFITDYCERSNFPWEKLSKYKVALPCECDYSECQGWAMVPSNPESIADHELFYSPNV